MANRYLATTGNNANPGTSGSPWATFQYAVGQLVPGDVLYARGGTYTDRIFEEDFTSTGTAWTTGNFITISAYPTGPNTFETVTIRVGSGGNIVRFLDDSVHHVIVQAMILDGVDAGGLENGAIVYFGDTSHHLKFVQLEVKDGEGVGVLGSGDSHELRDLDVHGNGTEGIIAGVYKHNTACYLSIITNSLVIGGRFWDNECIGLRVGSSGGTDATGNIVDGVQAYNNGAGIGLGGLSPCDSIGAGILVADVNNTVRNCVVWNNTEGIVVYALSGKTATGLTIYNNTCHDNVSYGINVEHGNVSGAIIKNNILFDNGGSNTIGDSGTGTVTGNNLTSDPDFTDAAGHDYTLQAGSDAIGAGANLSAVFTTDFTGATRTVPFDCGAYQFAVGMATTTTFYLTRNAPIYAPATFRGAWNDSAGAVTRALAKTKVDGGAITSNAVSESSASNNYDVCLYRGVSKPLSTQTLSGTINVVLGTQESSLAANCTFHLHVFVTQGNSDTVRGTILTDHVEAMPGQEWQDSPCGSELSMSGTAISSLSIQDGDRLVVEIGATFANTSSTPLTATLWYGTQHPSTLDVVDDLEPFPATDVDVKAGFIWFDFGIEESPEDEEESPVEVGDAFSWILQAELAGAGEGWTTVSDDVRATEPILLSYGIDGNSPTDRIAGAGELSWAFDNSTLNSLGLLGAYSLQHMNKRPGFDYNIGIRLILGFNGVPYYKFLGRLADIAPEPGVYGSRVTRCRALDWMDTAARIDLPDLEAQEDQTVDEILDTILDEMDEPPRARDFDSGTDNIPMSLDGGASRGRIKVREILAQLAATEGGKIYIRGDNSHGGTLTFEARRAAVVDTIHYNFTDEHVTRDGINAHGSRDDIIGRIQVTVHPVDTVGDTVLYSLKTTETLVGAGETLTTLFGPYRDPTVTGGQLIGGTAFNTPTATTDYLMNAAQDGSSTNLTANFVVTASTTGRGVRWTIENTGGTAGYITKLQLRGTAIYRTVAMIDQPVTVGTGYGERVLAIDMPFQNSVNVAQNVATYLAYALGTPAARIDRITFMANKSETLLTQALAREPGDRITVTETLTGISATFVIQKVTLSIDQTAVWASFDLAPAKAAQQYWLAGVPHFSEAGETTYAGAA